jgi:hypothetical protein
MADVLVSPLGRSPGAVSGVYFALKAQWGIEVSQVVTVGTSHPDVKTAARDFLARLFGHIQVDYDPIHVPAMELRGGKKNIAPYVAMVELALKNAQEAGHRVHVAVTGGRSGMGALAALATNFYGADHLWHLWVRREIEEKGTVDQLRGLRNPARMIRTPTLNPTEVEDGCEVVSLPFVDLRPLHEVLWDYRREDRVPKLPSQLVRFFDSAGIQRFTDIFPAGLTFGQADRILELMVQYVEAHPQQASVQTVDTAIEKRVTRQRQSRVLSRTLDERFNIEELQSLCFHLGVDFDNLLGQSKERKAEELIAYLERRDRVSELIQVGRQARQDIPWDEIPMTANISPQIVPAERWPQVQVGIIGELAEIMRQAGVVEESDQQHLIDLVTGQAVPQALFEWAQRAQRDRLGLTEWLLAHKEEVELKAKVTGVGVGALGLLLKGLELYLRANGYL